MFVFKVHKQFASVTTVRQRCPEASLDFAFSCGFRRTESDKVGDFVDSTQ